MDSTVVAAEVETDVVDENRELQRDGEKCAELRCGESASCHNAYRISDHVDDQCSESPSDRLERQPKKAEYCDVHPCLRMGDRLLTVPEVLEDRDTAPVVAVRMLCPDGLTPDRVDRRPAV